MSDEPRQVFGFQLVAHHSSLVTAFAALTRLRCGVYIAALPGQATGIGRITRVIHGRDGN
jgi:hypothetical protein